MALVIGMTADAKTAWRSGNKQGRIWQMACEQTKDVRIFFENGDSAITMINGTKEQIEQYYLNKTFNIGTVNDNVQKCIKIEFLENR